MTLGQSNNCYFSDIFCIFQRKMHISQCTYPNATKFGEDVITKSSSISKNLGFIWLLDCYQILILPPLLHAENCYTMADKIHSKTKASLTQFSWNFYRISYHKSRSCIPNLKSIQRDLITQTWLRSQLAQILQYRTNFNHLSYTSSNMNQTWN